MKTREMAIDTARTYFDAGYRFFIGSYYGESEEDDFEEVIDALTIEDHEEWLYVESVTVDTDLHEVHIFIGNDE